MKKILTILGARPQFVKASVVSKTIAESAGVSEVVVHTGQHFDGNMSDIFFSELGMGQPKHHLNIHGGGHGEMTGRMLMDVEKILLQENPDAVLVYGDTNSTLAGALAASKLHIPLAHVEAGLRSFNMRMPEEVNRVLTDRVSRWLFTPTKAAKDHLIREGVDTDKIIDVGDVMFDVALYHGERAREHSEILKKLDLRKGSFILVTVHRAENTDDPHRLEEIVAALEQVATQVSVIWPIHPRTRTVLERSGRMESLKQSGVRLIDPVGYLDMVQLEMNAAAIATDSGGVQKEAYFFRVPCITLRDETEWMELVESGWNRLIAPNSRDDINLGILRAIGSKGAEGSFYGDGTAAAKIVQCLRKDLLA